MRISFRIVFCLIAVALAALIFVGGHNYVQQKVASVVGGGWRRQVVDKFDNEEARKLYSHKVSVGAVVLSNEVIIGYIDNTSYFVPVRTVNEVRESREEIAARRRLQSELDLKVARWADFLFGVLLVVGVGSVSVVVVLEWRIFCIRRKVNFTGQP